MIAKKSSALITLISLLSLISFALQAEQNLATFTTSSAPVINQEESSDDWQDDWAEDEVASPWQLTGFIEAAQGQFLQSNIVRSTSSLSELRARINLDYSHELFEFTAKAETIYDDVLADTLWQTRELNVSVSPFSFVDIKVGRQILTWGTGDYLFLNDLFPKDWQSFFSGRDDQYLKAPSDSIRSSWYINNVTFELAWTPQFTSDEYITGERFSFYSSQVQQIVAPDKDLEINKTDNEQWSSRLTTNLLGIELAVYGYKGYWPTPAGVNSDNQGYFPRLNSWGVSALAPFMDGIFNFEYASYNSIDDSHGDDATIVNGQQRLLLGYERELGKDLTASFQYYLEKTKDYEQLISSSINPEQQVDENRQLLTLRLTYRTRQQTLNYSLFAFYSHTDSDAYLKPSLDYRYDDHWSFATGANVFFGENDYSFFGQHKDNTNAWLRARYEF
jgi:hypothetical protein